MTREELDALEALATTPEPPKPVKRTKLTGRKALRQWLRLHGIVPGDVMSVEISTLWALWLAWPQRPEAGMHPHLFAIYFKKLGFKKGRKTVKGRDTRPVLTTDYCARQLRAWAKANPTPDEVRRLFYKGRRYGRTLEDWASGQAHVSPDAGVNDGGRDEVAQPGADGDERPEGGAPDGGAAEGGA